MTAMRKTMTNKVLIDPVNGSASPKPSMVVASPCKKTASNPVMTSVSDNLSQQNLDLGNWLSPRPVSSKLSPDNKPAETRKGNDKAKKQMKIESMLYSPSQTWNEFLGSLAWRHGAHLVPITEAFREAVRRGISKSDAFCDVAERIHRSFCPVNWGVLNWQWKAIVAEGDQTRSANHRPGPARSLPRPLAPKNFQNHNAPKLPINDPQNGYRNPTRYSCSQNGTRNVQRRAASLASYYE